MENASYREATGELAAQISSLQAAVDALGVQAAVDPAASRAMDKLPAVVKSRAMGGAAPTWRRRCSAARSARPTARSACCATCSARSRTASTSCATASSAGRRWRRRRRRSGRSPAGCRRRYGNRRDPFTGGADFHPGLDISADYGQPVHAPADGVVDQRRLQRQLRQPGRRRSRLRDHDAIRPPVALRRVSPASRSTAATSSATSARPAARRARTSTTKCCVNGQLTNPLKLLAGR